MSKPHGVIFTGWIPPFIGIIPQAGPYRMRTFLEQNGYHVEVIDHLQHLNIAYVMNILELLYHDGMVFIGFSVNFYRQLKDNVLRSIKLRWPHLKLILGGQEVTPYVKDYAFADKAILGYSETAFLHYLDYLTGKRPDDLEWTEDEQTGVSYVIADKKYPYTETNDLSIVWKPDDPYAMKSLPLETSRGCIFKCLFCAYPLIGKKKMDYLRGMDSIADEIKRNHDMFGTEMYSFMDDTLNDSVAKLEHINKAIKKSGVKIRFSCYMRIDLVAAFPQMVDILLDMGLIGGFLGIESMNETVRKRIGKGLTNEKILATIDAFRSREQRVWFQAGFIVGLPGETIQSIMETDAWLRNQNRRYIDNWDWFPLYIARHNRWLTSEFQRNYQKYGYRFKTDYLGDCAWESDLMNYETAKRLADAMNIDNEKLWGIGSWMASDLSNFGVSLEQQKTMSWSDGMKLMNKSRNGIINKYKNDMLEKAKLISSS